MSHSLGAVLFKDKSIKYFEYNGTVDVCQPKLFSTSKEVYDNWRTNDWPQCNNTEHNHQKVRIFSSYGKGFSWDGFACLNCDCLLSPLGVNYDTEKSGIPDWFLPDEK